MLAAVADEGCVGGGPAVGAAVPEADAEGVLDRLRGGEGGLEGAVFPAPLQPCRFQIFDDELLDGDRAAVHLSDDDVHDLALRKKVQGGQSREPDRDYVTD